ncbi:Phosphatidylinositide phosphatase SAC2 like protein [Verticillium longisporum]|uniref:Phosphatidylinositide phosphatase SAC2 like protein n=1 Tax=Verticillium longisporum TaxID=100787 RepID=A0A8I3ASK2_VERLO|nr:Phosphatidylinositide phosphatase SAC2 like protein [Verticillium longisporum]
MPGIARKVVICAAIDGLIVQPLSSKGQRPAQPVRIGYGDGAISPAPRDQLPDLTKPNTSFEAFGVVGLITLSKLNFLITITRRHQVAQILGFPIYVVTEVAITPCASRQEAEDAVHRTSMQLQTRTDDTDTEDSDGDSTIELMAHAADEVDDQTQSEGSISAGVKSTVAEDVMSRKGGYGRFAQRWFSSSGWMQGQKRNAGWSYTTTESPRASMDQRPDLEPPAASKVPLEEEDDRVNEAKASSLLPKLLRTAQILYGSSRSFFFSYDVDITRHWATRAQSPSDELPLYRRVEPTFFWNRNTSQPFIDSGNDALVLPLMQGFVGQREFIMDKSPPQHDEDANDALEMSNMSALTSPPGSPPAEAIRGSLDLRGSEKKFLITVISRRSIKRAGLRYLRRGVDEDGHVANAVETEQILSNSSWDQSSKIYSFLQIRGSIPLFFTQSPYSLKPAPVIQHSTEANFEASKKHFERLHREYGMLQVVNLVEKHNVEATIGNEYQNTVVKLNETVFSDHTSQVPFEWFDFHAACRGMKFENVSLLLDAMRTKLDELGSTVEKDGELFLRQRGVLRTNCMDCLDRTNVCQSSFAKYMLESQLKAEGYDLSMQVDQQSAWFNTLWADNGDSVSKQYASTAAMKGDYTRYKTRNYRGMLNDLGFSLTRFYNGMVNDYFSQAAIDFLLGNVTSMVFQEFEAEMMTKDPAMSMLKMRESAIELCQKRVISDQKEDFVGGWVMLSPPMSDAVKSQTPFEEVILLLTDAALYLCRFDWKLDKVSSFERVDLAHIVGIRFGTYITSTVSPGHTDESKNIGFVVSYQPGKTDIQRTNTRTLSSNFVKQPGQAEEESSATVAVAEPAAPSGLMGLLSGHRPKPQTPTRKLAFKAPYSQSSAAVTGEGPRLSETQQVVSICADVERLAFKAQPGKDVPGTKSIIERGDIISLEDARANTTILDQLSHSIKKLVWA